MNEIFGYGEDALTLWALRRHMSTILDHFKDKSLPSDCLTFYRPSFGRHSKRRASVFGEFDAIVASSQNIYLVESKWDNLTESKNDKLTIRPEQWMRHRILSWYLTHWNRRYSNRWTDFIREQQHAFHFRGKTIAPAKSLLAENLEFILDKLLQHCKAFSSENNITNALLFFHKTKSRPPRKINKPFKIIPIDYEKETKSNYLSLWHVFTENTEKHQEL